MARPVKGTRTYNSPRRREQAAATRGQILEAAQRLFVSDGYAATTMAAIAAEAGVALKTVYLAFDSKSGVLRGVWDVALGGADDAVPVDRRAWYREVVDEPDPERKLRLNARNSRVVKQRAAPLMEVIRSAAHVDQDSSALWELIQSEFHDNQRSIVTLLHRAKALRPGLGVDRATDILWTLNHPDVWQLLVVRCDWTPAQYERWFGDTVCAQLLRSAHDA